MEGAKYDEGKPDYLLLDPTFLEGIVKIREYGVAKYKDPESWKAVPDGTKRYKQALARHFIAWLGGEELDKESGLPHIDHMACNIMFIKYLQKEPALISYKNPWTPQKMANIFKAREIEV